MNAASISSLNPLQIDANDALNNDVANYQNIYQGIPLNPGLFFILPHIASMCVCYSSFRIHILKEKSKCFQKRKEIALFQLAVEYATILNNTVLE